MAGFWIQVVGSKKTGKTSILEQIVRELVRRGRKVCYVKHTHEEPTLDGENTDTARLMQAGAAAAVLAGGRSTIVFRSPGDETLERIALRDSLPGEIVIAEGFKGTAGKKIVVAGGDLDVGVLDGVVALVGDAPAGYRGPVFRPDEIARLCDLIEEASAPAGTQGWATSLTIDGREIPLNTFVQDILASGLLGMASALQNVEGGDTLEIRCRRTGRKA
jgi:molybdopterin-guanine dinucleotide biosynthesis protein B